MMKVERTHVYKILGFIILLLILAFTTIILLQVSSVILGPSRKACTKKVCLEKFLEGPPGYDDDGMKEYIRKRLLEESTGPLKLSGETNFDSNLMHAFTEIKKYFAKKRGGTFVVLGAGDGEYQDVTLPLERELGWSGLLVEPHPVLYSMLKSKGRTVTLSNTCASPFIYPTTTKFAYKPTSPGDSKKDIFEKYRFTKLKQLWEDDTDLETVEYQCIPLENLIYAAEIKKEIDLLVLDMSGTDLDILVNVRLDFMPPVEMILIRSHGNAIGPEVTSFFLDSNIVVYKLWGTDANNVTYLLKKFRSEEEL